MAAHNIVGLPKVGIVVFVLALCLLVVGCGGGGGSQERQQASPVVGSFVGETSEPNTFVALVASKPEQGESQRQVRGYLCDGGAINEWFRGSVDGNSLDLSSDDGARLAGDLASSAATGTITLADDTSVPFEASPAKGIADLYDADLSSDGTVSGTSGNGGQVEGKPIAGPQNGVYPVTLTITPRDGQPKDLQTTFPANQPGEFGLIVLPDGRMHGGGKGKLSAIYINGLP